MAPNKKIAARRLEALAFFNDPARVQLVPGADIGDLVARYARMTDKRPAMPKPGPSTAAIIREETESFRCEDETCEVPGTVGRTYRDCYTRPADRVHFHHRKAGRVRCPNCSNLIQLRTWWDHGCAGVGTAVRA